VYVKISLADRGFVDPEKKADEETNWSNMRPHMFIPVRFGPLVLHGKVLTTNLILAGEPQLFFQEEIPF
jgi:hypothetical protein